MPKARASDSKKTKLSYFLAGKLEERGWSINDAADHLEVNRQSLTNIVNGSLKKTPGIETLRRLAEGFDTPLIDIMQMAGIEVYRPDGEEIHHWASMVERVPELHRAVELISLLNPDERQMVLSWLTVVTQDRLEAMHGSDQLDASDASDAPAESV